MSNVLKVESYQVGPLENNTYLVLDSETAEAVLVDPSMGSEPLVESIRARRLNLKAILNTHGHFDHGYNNGLFSSAFGCPIRIHEGDLDLLRDMARHAALFGFRAEPSPEPSGFLKGGDEIAVGGGKLRVLHTPGHSPGGTCFASEGFVLCGDTLFAQSIGRTDLPGGDYETLVASIRRELYALADATEVYPGHGPSTLIGFEKRHNPFVKAIARSGGPR
jgi:hydroxyacylglutathione hydrolase